MKETTHFQDQILKLMEHQTQRLYNAVLLLFNHKELTETAKQQLFSLITQNQKEIVYFIIDKPLQ